MGEWVFIIKNIPFLHSQSDHGKTNAPNLISIHKYKIYWLCRRASDRCWQIQIWCYLDHWPCIMHKLGVKEEEFDCLARAEKLHFLLPWQLWWARLKHLCKGITWKCQLIVISPDLFIIVHWNLRVCYECESTRYIVNHEDPSFVRSQRNSYRPCVRINASNWDSRCCYDTRRGRIKSCLKDISEGDSSELVQEYHSYHEQCGTKLGIVPKAWCSLATCSPRIKSLSCL